ncbi:MAG TPA: hypothetical protein VH639_10415 [Bryobacteraceae bacterium]|jgi:hypothetical protein
MDFDPAQYGAKVAQILALLENGNRLLPLDWGAVVSPAHEKARNLLENSPISSLFAHGADPRAAVAGLWLYFDCFEEAHQLADACENPNGYYWHAIVHRREGDSGNAAYWFRKTGAHPAYQPLAAEAAKIAREFPGAEFRGGAWDPFLFVSFCDPTRRLPGSRRERIAMEIQRAEWQILFDHCARPANAERSPQ